MARQYPGNEFTVSPDQCHMCLLLRLEGQVGFCGPVSLLADGGALETISVRANRESLTMRAKLGYDVVCGVSHESQPGAKYLIEVTLHSAVQVSPSCREQCGTATDHLQIGAGMST
jgi:hypothetical protein